MTSQELRDAEAAYQAAFAACEAAREARNALLRQAVTDGWSHADIAKATGMTRSRVGQLVLPRPT